MLKTREILEYEKVCVVQEETGKNLTLLVHSSKNYGKHKVGNGFDCGTRTNGCEK